MTETLAILGCGTLGRSMALAAASKGLTVRLGLRTSARIPPLMAAFERAIRKTAPEHAEAILQRLVPCSDPGIALEGASIAFEALPEELLLKQSAWRTWWSSLPETCLRLTGTSSLPLAQISRGLPDSERLIGFHAFVPLHRMRVVELVEQADLPAPDAARVRDFATCLGLTVCHVADGPGFAASRMSLAMGLEAMRLLERHGTSPEALDSLMVLGYGHPVGPLELSDRVGLDVRLSIAMGLHHATADPVFSPPNVLKSLVQAGHLGRKSGQGFFRWTSDGTRL